MGVLGWFLLPCYGSFGVDFLLSAEIPAFGSVGHIWYYCGIKQLPDGLHFRPLICLLPVSVMMFCVAAWILYFPSYIRVVCRFCFVSLLVISSLAFKSHPRMTSLSLICMLTWVFQVVVDAFCMVLPTFSLGAIEDSYCNVLWFTF